MLLGVLMILDWGFYVFLKLWGVWVMVMMLGDSFVCYGVCDGLVNVCWCLLVNCLS